MITTACVLLFIAHSLCIKFNDTDQLAIDDFIAQWPSMKPTFREDCSLTDRGDASMVVCDGSGHVVKLSINDRGLDGLLPTSLVLLTELRHLSLYANKLTGTMGDASGSPFSSLTHLTHLALHNNLIIGFIPTQLGLLSNLTVLSLRRNTIMGTLPTELNLLTQLKTLSLYGNRLYGDVRLSNNASYDYCMLNCPFGVCKPGDDNCFTCPLKNMPLSCATGAICGTCNALRAYVPPAPTPPVEWPAHAWLAPFLIALGLIVAGLGRAMCNRREE